MTKQQLYLASILCLCFAFTYVVPIAGMGHPYVAVIFCSSLIAFGGVFFLIGVNK